MNKKQLEFKKYLMEKVSYCISAENIEAAAALENALEKFEELFKEPEPISGKLLVSLDVTAEVTKEVVLDIITKLQAYLQKNIKNEEQRLSTISEQCGSMKDWTYAMGCRDIYRRIFIDLEDILSGDK